MNNIWIMQNATKVVEEKKRNIDKLEVLKISAVWREHFCIVLNLITNDLIKKQNGLSVIRDFINMFGY